MNFWNWLTRRREDHGWPGYIINGRIRTSTAALILAFCVIAWLHNTYQPAPATPSVPESAQVVPPGFMPDPDYTWVPRTNVQTQPRTTYQTTPTTTTTTEETPSEPATPTGTTSGTSTTGSAPTTFVDPDGAGPLPPTPVTAAPTSPSSPSSPSGPSVANRSGTSTTTTTTISPGQIPVPETSATPQPPR